MELGFALVVALSLKDSLGTQVIYRRFVGCRLQKAARFIILISTDVEQPLLNNEVLKSNTTNTMTHLNLVT